jgi:hypothetical protein
MNNIRIPIIPSNYYIRKYYSVMATTNIDGKAGFSNYGKITVDMSARIYILSVFQEKAIKMQAEHPWQPPSYQELAPCCGRPIPA